MPILIQCNGLDRSRPVNGFFLAYDLRPGETSQRLFSDQRVEAKEMEYSIHVAGPNTPPAFEEAEQQLAYVVGDNGGRFCRDGEPFRTWHESGAGASLFKYTLDRAGGDPGAIQLSIAGHVLASGTVAAPLHARIVGIRIYDRPLTPHELKRNWTAGG